LYDQLQLTLFCGELCTRLCAGVLCDPQRAWAADLGGSFGGLAASSRPGAVQQTMFW